MKMETKINSSYAGHTLQKMATTVLLMVLACAVQAQTQDYYEKMTDNQRWYADHSEKAILRYEGLKSHAGKLPQKYCMMPSKEAAPLDFAMVISNYDNDEAVVFTPNGDDLKAKRIDFNTVPDSIYWEDISELCRYRTPEKDITLREKPLPVRQMNKQKNTFTVVRDKENPVKDISAYRQMMFKPHQNAVRLANQKRNFKQDSEGNTVKDEMEYTFKLTNANIMPKMFRGYDNGEACPWVVTDNFFKTHHLLQYSRWKYGEPIRKATADACRIISNYYGGRKIKETRWLANIESGERTFYAVQFEVKKNDALAAMVCIAEGEVASVWEFHGKVEDGYQDGQSIWFVDDEGNFMEHAPEIHAICTTDAGMELYVRLFGGESVQYYILREVGPLWMTLDVDYWIYVWD